MIRHRFLSFAALFALSLMYAAPAQSDGMSEASNALKGVNVEGAISTSKMRDVVEPYTTLSPSETSITHSTMQREIDQKLVDPDDPGTKAHKELRDGFTLRPDYQLKRDDPLNLRSEKIIDQKGERVGDLFTSTGSGVCTPGSFEGVSAFEVLCERIANFTVETCKEKRVITTDRRDTWQCSEVPRDITEHCDQVLKVTCNNSASCIRSILNVRGTSLTRYSRANTYTNITARYKRAKICDRDGYCYAPDYCQWVNHYVYFNVPSTINLTTLSLTSMTGSTEYRVWINNRYLGRAWPGFNPSNCGPQNSKHGLPTKNILPYIKAGQNTIRIYHKVGADNSVNLRLNHRGYCCTSPQFRYDDVNCEAINK